MNGSNMYGISPPGAAMLTKDRCIRAMNITMQMVVKILWMFLG